jgi:hypothetical protein
MERSVYLTDGRRLFRCLPSEGSGVALLEDCLTLECFHCEFEDVTALRVVKGAEPATSRAAPWDSDAEQPRDLGDRIDGRARNYA